MESLSYFRADDAEGVRGPTGRLTAAGVVMSLPAGAAAVAALAVMCNIMLQPVPNGLLSMSLAISVLVTLALLLGTTAVGLFRRRRWSRPLALAVMLNELIASMTVQAKLLPQIFVEYSNSVRFFPDRLIDQIAPYAIFEAIIIGLPLTILILLARRDLRNTLNFHDLHPRWTDRWTVGGLTVLVMLAVSALVCAFVVADVFDDAWLAVPPYPRAALVAAASFDVFAGYWIVRGRPEGRWTAMAVTLVIGAAVVATWSADRWLTSPNPQSGLPFPQNGWAYQQSGWAQAYACACAAVLARFVLLCTQFRRLRFAPTAVAALSIGTPATMIDAT